MAEISTIARPYAVALFKLAKEEKKLSSWSDFLALLNGLVKDKELNAFLGDTKVLDIDRVKTLLKCVGDIDDKGKNLIKLLIENKRLMVIPYIFNIYEELKASEEGSIEAQIIVAETPDSKVVDRLIKGLEKKFDKKAHADMLTKLAKDL